VIKAQASKDAAFQAWVTQFEARAVARGFSERLVEQAFRGVAYNEEVIGKDRNQAEFSLPLWDYLARLVSDE